MLVEVAPTDRAPGCPSDNLALLTLVLLCCCGPLWAQTLSVASTGPDPVAPAALPPMPIEPEPSQEPYQVGVLPPDATPTIPDRNEIILCIHGGPGSRLEECGDLVEALHAAGLRKNVRYTVVSFDQPTQGYSTMADPSVLFPSHDKTGGYYPLVAFSEEFIVAFINELDKIMHIKNRNIYVIGGSTGGALALRLGHRQEPWIKKIVAWNPASVWTTYHSGIFKRLALWTGFERSEASESPGAREGYFNSSFGKPTRTTQPNPEEWYRGDRDRYAANRDTQKPFREEWPCKWDYIAASRLEQEEVYNEAYRRWHWRLGSEMLLFSFFNDDWMGPAKTAETGAGRHANYESIHIPTLLVATDDDDWNVGSTLWFHRHWENRWDRTRIMATRMGNTPGHTLYVPDTGHSIHNERPVLFGNEVVKFLTDDTAVAGPLEVRPVLAESQLPVETCHEELPSLPAVPSELLQIPDSAAMLTQPARLGGRFSNNEIAGRYSLRLKSQLRDVAHKKDPTVALGYSAARYYNGENVWGDAYADLAVTGRGVYDALRKHQPTDVEVAAAARQLLTRSDRSNVAQGLDETKLRASVRAAQDRAYRVAWALRGPNEKKRFEFRRTLGWIAVSGEDDPPARPVNVPSGIPIWGEDGQQVSSYPQYELSVTMCGSSVSPFRAYLCQPGAMNGTNFEVRYTIANAP